MQRRCSRPGRSLLLAARATRAGALLRASRTPLRGGRLPSRSASLGRGAPGLPGGGATAGARRLRFRGFARSASARAPRRCPRGRGASPVLLLLSSTLLVDCSSCLARSLACCPSRPAGRAGWSSGYEASVFSLSRVLRAHASARRLHDARAKDANFSRTEAPRLPEQASVANGAPRRTRPARRGAVASKRCPTTRRIRPDHACRPRARRRSGARCLRSGSGAVRSRGRSAGAWV